MNIASPCINICRMNREAGYCEGCFRTIPEITEWSRASDERRSAILALVAERRLVGPSAGAVALPDVQGAVT